MTTETDKNEILVTWAEDLNSIFLLKLRGQILDDGFPPSRERQRLRLSLQTGFPSRGSSTFEGKIGRSLSPPDRRGFSLIINSLH